MVFIDFHGSAGQKVGGPKGPAMGPTPGLDTWIFFIFIDFQGSTGRKVRGPKGPAVGPTGVNLLCLCPPGQAVYKKLCIFV